MNEAAFSRYFHSTPDKKPQIAPSDRRQRLGGKAARRRRRGRTEALWRRREHGHLASRQRYEKEHGHLTSRQRCEKEHRHLASRQRCEKEHRSLAAQRKASHSKSAKGVTLRKAPRNRLLDCNVFFAFFSLYPPVCRRFGSPRQGVPKPTAEKFPHEGSEAQKAVGYAVPCRPFLSFPLDEGHAPL